jgi:Fe-S-cluster containining protein
MVRLKQIIPQKFCLECRGCCRFYKKKTIWSAHLLNQEKQNLSCKYKQLRLIPHPQESIFICEFFQWQDNLCRVYTRRPFDCQLYPFLLQRMGKKVFLALDLNCPFAQENQASGNFLEFSRYLITFLQRPSLCRILKDNPQVIQRYAQAKLFTELKF